MSIFSRVSGPFVIPNANAGDMQTSQNLMGGHAAFITAKVIDFISDPKTLSESKINEIKNSVTNSSLINSMPVNSIWCQIIEANRLDQHIAYPFFPAHLCLPIKPAEQVWIFYSPTDQVYYWVCRKPGDYISEDVNYTHIDRIVNKPITIGTAGVEPQVGAKDAFNGTLPDTVNFPQGKTDSVYVKTSGVFFDDTQIIEQSQEYQEKFIQEAVPRLVRQPGDLVMQGSNNSTIVLGSSENKEGKGVIDIVTGRFLRTNPVTNTRGYKEVDKTRTATSDGQTDLAYDDARVYLGMNEDADSEFRVNISGIPGSGTSSCAVVKGNHVRLLGRGNVKITSQASGASIVLQETGDVIIVPGDDGKVYLAGAESNQSYLRYDEFNDIINRLIDMIAALQSSLGPASIAAAAAAASTTAAGNPPGTPLGDAYVENAVIIANPDTFGAIEAYTNQVNNLLRTIKSQKILGT